MGQGEKMSALKKYGIIALVAIVAMAVVYRVPAIRSKVLGG